MICLVLCRPDSFGLCPWHVWHWPARFSWNCLLSRLPHWRTDHQGASVSASGRAGLAEFQRTTGLLGLHRCYVAMVRNCMRHGWIILTCPFICPFISPIHNVIITIPKLLYYNPCHADVVRMLCECCANVTRMLYTWCALHNARHSSSKCDVKRAGCAHYTRCTRRDRALHSMGYFWSVLY
jgi:hypothetical protein